MDKGTLYTHALARLGDHNDIAGSDEHIACEAFAQQALGICFDYSRWTWASKRITLNISDGSITLPVDCLRLESTSLPAYTICGRTLYTDSSATSVTLTYTSSACIDTITLPDYEPTFCEACILMLAALIAPRLTDNLTIAQQLKQEAYAALRRAKLKDARVSDSNDQTPSL
ncbi:MAG: hypothetical protein ACI4O9_08050 [Akkermansia sp.]